MTYDTVIDELLTYLPELRAYDEGTFHYLDTNPPLPHIIFGSLLIPFLEIALETGDLKHILRTCAFLEEASESARSDNGLRSLIQIEIGEWLSRTPLEEKIAPWLGSETKRIANFVPGLATQRLNIREERMQNSISARARTLLDKLFKVGAK